MADRDGLFRRREVGGRRPHRTVIRHSDAEWERVSLMAQARGVSVPRLYERALLAGGVVESEKLASIQLQMIAALRMIGLVGVNINQMAAVANATGEIHAAQIEAAAASVDRHLVQLRKVLDRLPDASRMVLYDHGPDPEDPRAEYEGDENDPGPQHGSSSGEDDGL